MNSIFRRSVLPALAFLFVIAAHFIWQGYFPEHDPVQDQWAAVPTTTNTSWSTRYLETQAYLLGYSYGLSTAFAVLMLRRFRETQNCRAKRITIGSVTFSGLLAATGCFLLGCCGSPMLMIYLNLFGAAFLPLAKPLIALLTTAMVAVAWWWVKRVDVSCPEEYGRMKSTLRDP